MNDTTQWLTDRGLEKYIETFEEHEIDLIALPELTEDDLREMELISFHIK